MDKEYIYFRESAFQSALADILTFGFLGILFAFNHFVLDDSKVAAVAFFLVFMMFAMAKGAAQGRRFKTKDELQKYVNETLDA
jgi:hypothetical protein